MLEAGNKEVTSSVTPFINSSNIKLIIFDLHGTITNRTSVHPYHVNYRNKYMEEKLGHPLPEKFFVYTEEAFKMYPQLDKIEFYHYRDNDPNFSFEKIHSPNNKLAIALKNLSSSFHLMLYTDSYQKQIDRTLTAIGLTGLFDSIIGIENGKRKISPGTSIYSDFCNQFDINMDNILVVGDRLDKDIKPVLQSGGNAIMVESNTYILEAIDFINERFRKPSF